MIDCSNSGISSAMINSSAGFATQNDSFAMIVIAAKI